MVLLPVMDKRSTQINAYSSAISRYIALLKRYNQHTNIYSAKAYDHLPFHIENCQELATIIGDETHTIVDMGSGSGLPAIILAICLSNSSVFAVESKSRKTRFLTQVKNDLNLTNLTVINEDINVVIHNKTLKPSIITAKAFAPYNKVIQLSQKMVSQKKRPLQTTLYIPMSELQYKTLSQQSNIPFSFSHTKDNHYFLYYKVPPLRHTG